MPGGVEKACHRCISKIASNACFIVLLFTFLALPLSMAFTGMKFLEDCPIQPLIPLYLLVGGIIGALKVSLLLYDSTRMRRLLSKAVVIDDDDDDEYPWRQNAHKGLLNAVKGDRSSRVSHTRASRTSENQQNHPRVGFKCSSPPTG
ncbi:transmembrane protein 272 isoform X4 [Vicugna pacos]|uniref:Transmembrane protein 272 isoform X4 n=1 Tax=Vicugna pacos TaxID=30538 RepID=A0ABM5EGK9_VICPA